MRFADCETSGIRVLKEKTILLISPAPWGDLRVSKHHYAHELAKAGNRVLFLEPPREHGTKIELRGVAGIPGLEILTFGLNTPQLLRFHARRVHDYFVRRDIRRLLTHLGVRIDIVWCFELNLYVDLRRFCGRIAVYHPVDEIVEEHQLEIAASADAAVTVSESIAGKLRRRQPNTWKVGHGLAAPFVQNGRSILEDLTRDTTALVEPRSIRVGYIGNLRIPGIDRIALRDVIVRNPEVRFEFWGPYTGPPDPEADNFIRLLSMSRNVTLRGLVPPESIALQLQGVDAFLLCYDLAREPNGGSNSHKILEYLSSGKVVISTHVSEYAGSPRILEMLPKNAPEGSFVALFESSIARITELNAAERMRERIQWAIGNSYEAQLKRIDEILARIVSPAVTL